MSITVADPLIATLYHLRGNSTTRDPAADDYLTALHLLVSTERIATRFRDEWGEPGKGITHNCIIVAGSGGFGKETYIPIAQTRIDIKCYGRQPHIAQQMARLVTHLLIPIDRGRSGWTAANTRVSEVLSVTDPLLLTEPDTAYLYALMSSAMRYRERAVTTP